MLLALLIVLFEIASGGTFLSYENVRGILGLLPEVGLVAIGVTILMICWRIRSIRRFRFCACADGHGGRRWSAGLPFVPAVLLGLSSWRASSAS